MSYHVYGEMLLDVPARTATLHAMFATGAAAEPETGLDDARLAAFVEELGTKTSHHETLAAALAALPTPQTAALALLDAGDTLEALCADADALARFVRVAAASRTYGRFLASHRRAALDRAAWLGEVDTRIADTVDAASAVGEGEREATVSAFEELLRLRKRLRMLAIVDAELRGVDVLETAADIASVAEEAIADSVRFAVRLEDAAGIRFAVLGMGKLGAGELNLSSDVDLIYIYDPAEPAPADQELARAVARRVTGLVDKVTALGPVFRVDLRLRPFGTQGAIAHAVGEMVHYYETHGRQWERGALIKARLVGGDAGTAERLESRLRSFVYPRSVSVDAVAEVAAMKADALRRQRRVGRQGDVDLKLGPGGIREIEFFVQAFQMIYGGRLATLRERPTVPALRALVAAGLVPHDDVEPLVDAYRFLRTVEHRIQMDEERQTHRLPAGTALDELSLRLGFASSESFVARLDIHRAAVGARFGALFAEKPEAPTPTWFDDVLDESATADERAAAAAGAGFARAARVVKDLGRLAAPPEPVLGRHAPRAARRAARSLVEAVARSADPDRGFDRVFELLAYRGRRQAAIRIIDREPRAAALLATLLGAADEIGRTLVRYPHLLTSLLTHAVAAQDYDAESLHGRLQGALANELANRGRLLVERELAIVQRFRIEEESAVALAQIADRCDIREATRRLSAIAETALRSHGALAARDLGHRIPGDRVARLGVVALGKLGAGELGHGGDLDVVFVFDDTPDRAADYARLARRWLGFAASLTPYGRTHPIDVRLRPDGTKGAVVTTVAGFEDYYSDRAWAWEKLAALRARPLVVHDPAVAARLERALERCLDDLDLDEALPELARIRRSRLAEAEGRPFDFKQCAGGLADLELCIQLRQLQARRRGGWEGPREGNSWRAIERLCAAGQIPTADRAIWLGTLAFLRELESWVRLSEGPDVSCLPKDPRRVSALARRVVGTTFDPADRAAPSGALRDEIASHTGWVVEALEKSGVAEL